MFEEWRDAVAGVQSEGIVQNFGGKHRAPPHSHKSGLRGTYGIILHLQMGLMVQNTSSQSQIRPLILFKTLHMQIGLIIQNTL